MAKKTENTVESLVSMIERGELGLPEMQRPYVWRSTRVRDLLDSLYRGYPSGTILLWESDKLVPQRKTALEQEKANPVRNSCLLLLDGQQRLTSLAAVIRGKPVAVRGRKRPIELLFNLEHPDKLDFFTEVHEDGSDDVNGNERAEDEADSTEDELQRRFNRMTFVVATGKLARLPQWVKVSEVFKADSDTAFLKQAGVKGFDDPNYDRYQKRLAALRNIRKYTYRIDVLEKLSYEEVTDIYVRVNSLGAKLRSSDLALAQITAKWHGSLEKFEAFQSELRRDGFDLDLGSVLLRNLVAFATGQSRFQTVGSLSIDTLQESWEKSCHGMLHALNFMRNNVHIESPALLASPLVLIAVSYFSHKRNYSFSSDESESLRRWVLLANVKGRYSRGSSETILDQDLRILREGKGVTELMVRLQQQALNLQVTPEELAGRNQNSALFKTMFLAFHAAGAKDWQSNLAISINNKGPQDKLQFHHIFPKAVLKDRLRDSHTVRAAARLADDIANLCFISGKTNRQLGKEVPHDYIPKHIQKAGPGMFEAQCIPTEERFLGLDKYEEFLIERRKRLAVQLNEFLHGSQ